MFTDPAVVKSTTEAATKNSPMDAIIPQIPAMVNNAGGMSRQQSSNKMITAMTPATHANHQPATDINKAITARI